MAKTKIEWATDVWNPTAGCSVVSPGCTNCYAMRMAGTRLAHTEKFRGLTEPSKAGPVWNGTVRLDDDALTQPLRWKTPRRIFVNSMSDLFHENLPDEMIDRVFAVMAEASWHTFLVLTKRAQRMQGYASDPETPGRIARAMDRIGQLSDDEEELRPIANYPGYFVSSLGHVYSDKRGQRRRLRPDPSEQGHLRVPLFREGGPRRGEKQLVHRLVLTAFHGPAPAPDSQGRHRDGNPGNNRASNLLWGDQSANWRDRIRHGSFRSYQKLTETQVIEIRRRLATGESAYSIAPDLGVSDTQIRNIRDGKQWATQSGVEWPITNCWLGVSVEDQARAAERVPRLLQTPAAVRFISAEPMLGPIDVRYYLRPPADLGAFERWRGLDWLIAGGESGPGARPMHPEWARWLRDQCTEVGAPFFFKQWGDWALGSDFSPEAQVVTSDGRAWPKDMSIQEIDHDCGGVMRLNPTMMRRVGKRAGGRLLDGREWNELPEVTR